MGWLAKFGRREVAALLMVALIAAGVLAILNRRNNPELVVAADAPGDALGSASSPEDPNAMPDVAPPDVTETPTTPPPPTPSPAPTSSTEGSQTPTTSTSPQPLPQKTSTTPQLSSSSATPTPAPAPSTASPSSQPISRTITISATPREGYTEILVSGGGCAGERYGVNLEVRDSAGEPIEGDGEAAAPDGSWELEQHWGADRPSGRYSFHARCIHFPEEGPGTTVFEYEPKTFDWSG